MLPDVLLQTRFGFLTFAGTSDPYTFLMQYTDPQILTWNVRGLNNAARCLAVHETLAATPCHIACLQETKLHSIDAALDAFLGAYKLSSFAFKPANGTRGGIMLLWNDLKLSMSNISVGRFSLTADTTFRHYMTTFTLSVVYGHSRRADRKKPPSCNTCAALSRTATPSG
jgi:hypothetical protein